MPARLDADQVRAEALAWFRANWDPDMTVSAWWAALADSGWGFPTWPSEWYGRDLPGNLAKVVTEARREVGALGPPAGIAQNLAGPTIIAHGTHEQKADHLPRIVAGEVWCQLFSEPGAGSDLAGLHTAAVRDGDEWIVNGQKVWTSGAHIANYGILVARTNPEVPKHRGLTYFVIDMRQPGIEVRPIREMTGRAIFNEVFFTDARVPHANLIGEEGGGWGVALTTLANERTMLGAGSFGSSSSGLGIQRPDPDATAGSLAARTGEGPGGPDGSTRGGGGGGGGDVLLELARARGLTADPITRQEIAQAYTLLEIARFTDLRVKAKVEAGGRPGPEVSVGKLAASHLLRTLRESMLRAMGPAGTLWDDDAPMGGRAHQLGLSSFLISIGGGTDQIQRNIIGERVLGLPAEPRADKDVPYSQIPRSVTR